MNESLYIHLAVEDILHEIVLRKILNEVEQDIRIWQVWGKKGSGYLKTRVKNYNQAARIHPWILLTDLDQVECAPFLIKNWLPESRHANFLFRIAVREVESWLLADREGFSDFLKISIKFLPQQPDELNDPKREVIRLVKKCRNRSLKEDMLPLPKSIIPIGPNYNGRLVEFVNKIWELKRAIGNSDSLKRTVTRIDSLSC